MSETTPRLGFYKPADDGSEPVNVATDINDNLERLDATVGAVPATTGTPPSGVFNGMIRQNTDDQSLYYYRNGSTWTQILAKGAAFAGDLLQTVGSKIGIGTLTPGAVIDAITGNASDILARFKVTGDTQPRVQIESTGIKLGPGGTTAPDVHIYRQNAATLNIDGNVVIEDNIQVNGTPAFTGGINVTGASVIDGDVNLTGGIDVEDHITFEGYPMMVAKRGTSSIIISSGTASNSNIVNFGVTFPTAPAVLITLTSHPGNSSGWGCRALSITTTGFTAFYSAAANAAGSFTLNINWVAFHEGV